MRLLAIAMMIASLLSGCASTATATRNAWPAGLRDKVQSLAPGALDCGAAVSDAERLSGYACVQQAHAAGKPFWFAFGSSDSPWFAWVETKDRKVLQLLPLGKQFMVAECKVFEVSTQGDGNIHCSI